MVVASVGDVGLGVRAWDTWGGAEVLEAFSVLGSSKEEGVGTYYNILIRIEEREKQIFLRRARSVPESVFIIETVPVGARRTS